MAQLLFHEFRVEPALLKQAPDVGIDQGLRYLGIGRCAARVEVVSDVAGEEEGLLHDAHDAGADQIARYRSDIESVDYDAAGKGI